MTTNNFSPVGTCRFSPRPPTLAPILHSAEEVANQMKKAGLSRITPAVLKLLRPSIRLFVDEPSEKPITRLGGSPNMPSEIAWPTRRSGDPLSFLAQIDLSGLPVCEGLPLPRTGSLLFFCDAEYLPDPSDPQDVKDGIKVVYRPTSLSDCVLRSTPHGLDSEYIFQGWSLNPRLDLTAPAQDIWEIESLHLSDAESFAYSDLFAQVSSPDGSVHRLGGYPNQVQYSKIEPADDWQLLLQLDSEDQAGMMWGDMGKLYFTIRETDLKSLSFEQVGMNWQCG
jgi:uncharacterized protein YwqG